MTYVDFNIVLPERVLLIGQAKMIIVPGGEGDFGVLPGHIPLIAALRPGVTSIYGDSEKPQRFFLTGGFAEVGMSLCRILADDAMLLESLDPEIIQREADQSRSVIEAAASDLELKEGELALAIARAKKIAHDYYGCRDSR